MEDVEERRKRLAAMREQAASSTEDVTVSSVPIFRTPPLLASPFLDSGDVAAAEGKDSRFNFYTDPLAGFQGSKRRRPGNGILSVPSPAPQSSSSTPRSGAGILPHPAHLQRVYLPPGSASWHPVSNQLPYLSPVLANPQLPPQFPSQIPPHHVNPFSNQASGGGTYKGFSGRFNGRQSPSGPTGSGGLSGRGCFPSSSGRGRGSDSFSNRGGRSNLSSRRSASEDSSRDGNRSEGSVARGRGQGQGGGRIVSAKEQPHLFLKKSMLEDPWRGLEANGEKVP